MEESNKDKELRILISKRVALSDDHNKAQREILKNLNKELIENLKKYVDIRFNQLVNLLKEKKDES